MRAALSCRKVHHNERHKLEKFFLQFKLSGIVCCELFTEGKAVLVVFPSCNFARTVVNCIIVRFMEIVYLPAAPMPNKRRRCKRKLNGIKSLDKEWSCLEPELRLSGIIGCSSLSPLERRSVPCSVLHKEVIISEEFNLLRQHSAINHGKTFFRSLDARQLQGKSVGNGARVQFLVRLERA